MSTRSRRTIKPTKRLYEDDDEQPPELSFIARVAKTHQEAAVAVQEDIPATANTNSASIADVSVTNGLSIDNMLGNDDSMPDFAAPVISGNDPFPALGPNDVLEPMEFQLSHFDTQPSIEPEPITRPGATQPQEPIVTDEKVVDAEQPGRRSSRNVVRPVEADDEDFIDAGAVDDAADSDASEMSKEVKGDHDVKIEDFDRPVMESLQTLDDVAAALEGKPNAAAGESGSLGTQAGRKIVTAASIDADRSKGTVAGKAQKPAPGGAKRVNKPVPVAPAALKPAAAPVAGARSPAEIRQNAANKYKEVLEEVVKDAKSKNDSADADLGDPGELAEQIETGAHTAYGNPIKITPKYTAQFRMLFFALRKNREAAMQVLRGEVTPDVLVRMSKEALADSKAVKLRQAVLEKSRRMAVLDDEAAAQFSTAANHALRQREIQEKLDREVRAREAQKAAEEQEAAARKRAAAERASVVAQHALLSQPVGDDNATAAATGADLAYDPESVPWDSGMMDMSFGDGAGEESPQQEVLSISDPGTPPAEMARRMEDDVQMADVAAAEAPGADPAYEPQGGQRGGVQPGEADRNATPPLTDAQRAALPGASGAGMAPDRLPRSSAGSVGVGNDGGAAFTHVEDFAPLVLSTPEGQVGGGAPGVRLWSGFVEFFGDGLTMRAELASLQGAADLSALVRGAIVVKGTLATSALLSFFEQLVNSRSRTVTLGVLRVSKKGLDETSLERITKQYQEFQRADRCCACFPGNQESYLIPAGTFATRLCATAHVAAHSRHKPSIPPALHQLEYVLAVVTKREAKDDILHNELQARLKRDHAWAEKKARLARHKSRHRKERSSHGRSTSGHGHRSDNRPDSRADAKDSGELVRDRSAGGSGALDRTTSAVPPTPLYIVPSDPRQARRAAATAAAAAAAAAPPAPSPAVEAKPADSPTPGASAPKTADFDIGASLSDLASVLGLPGQAPAEKPHTNKEPAGFPASGMPAFPSPGRLSSHQVAPPLADATKADDLPNIDALLAIVGNVQPTEALPAAPAAPQTLDVPSMRDMPSMRAPSQLSLQPAAGMARPHHHQPAGEPQSAPLQPGQHPTMGHPGHMGRMPNYQAAPSQPMPAEHARPAQLQPPQTIQPPHGMVPPQGMPQPTGVAQLPQYGRPGQPVQTHVPQMSQQMHGQPATGTSLPMPVQYAPQQPQSVPHGGGPGAPVIIQASPGTLHAPPHQAQPRYAPQPMPQPGPQPGSQQPGPPQPQPGAYPGWKICSGYAGGPGGDRDGRGGDGRNGMSYGGRGEERGWGDDIIARGVGPGTGAKRKAPQWEDRAHPRPGPEAGYDIGGRYEGQGGRGGRRRMGSNAARRGGEIDDRGGRSGRGRAPPRRENTHTLNHLHAPPPDLLASAGHGGRGRTMHPPPPPPPP